MQKQKKVRIKGPKLAALNKEIHERDNDKCIVCGAWVDPGEKFHHEPCGPNKQDRVECGVTICRKCHDERHFGAGLKEYRQKIEAYLEALYGSVTGRSIPTMPGAR